MQRCLQLAKNGLGTTRPNPTVGAVVVYNDKIIGEGFTSPYGGPHAEVNAINAVKDKSLLPLSTIYVTLEPCSHFGKTPPCADLIAKHTIKNVVIGCIDTNSLVAGKGIEKLKKAGCNVTVGVLESECFDHHKRFFTVQNKQRPHVILKWAQTQDGFIAPNHKDSVSPVWISNEYSKQLVHKFRSEEHAILVGTNTVIADNPSLTVRSWYGHNPIRVVLDKSLKLKKSLSVFDAKATTILITHNNNIRIADENNEKLIIEKIDFSLPLASQICEVLHKHKIQSVIIEGGTKTIQTFIDENLWDEAYVFEGKSVFKEGIAAPLLPKRGSETIDIEGDSLHIYKN